MKWSDSIGSTYAWVPWSDSEPLEVAADLAIAEVVAAGQEEGRQPRLVTVQRRNFDGVDRIAKLSGRWNSGTLRGRWPTGAGPVLAWVPTVSLIQRAMVLASGSRLVMVEWPDRPPGLWRSWAALVGAVNLRTGQPTPLTVSEELREDLEYVTWNGNNGWPRKDSITEATRRRLKAVAARGELDAGLFMAAAVIEGQTEHGLANLKSLIDSATPLAAVLPLTRPLEGDEW